MKNTKKILSLGLSSMIVLSSTVGFAANGDYYKSVDQTKHATSDEVLFNINDKGDPVLFAPEYYLYEYNERLYKMTDVNESFKAEKANFKDFLEKNYEGITMGPEVPEGELKVVEVSAINAGQIKIVFNKEVAATTIIPANFYLGLTKDVTNKSLADLNTTDYSVVLQKDEKTVIISGVNLAANVIWEDENTNPAAALITADGNVLKNRTVYVQAKDIKTKAGKLVSAMEGSFVAKDSEGPKFANASYTVEKVNVANFAITFNEPVVFENLGAANDKNVEFYLNGTNVTAHVDYETQHATVPAAPTTAAEYSALSIDLATPGIELEEGSNKFEVVGLQDLAGNATTPNRITTTIKVEEEGVTVVAPKVIAINQVHDGAFRVIFDKAVDGGDVIIKNLENDNVDAPFVIGAADGNYVAPDDTNYSAYLVEFDADSVYTTDTVYKGANEIIRTVEVKDYYINHPTTGNQVKGANHSKAYKFVKDNKAPTVVDYAIVSDDVVVEFVDAPFNGPVNDATIVSSVVDMVVKYVEDGVTYTYEVAAPTGIAANKLALGLNNTNAAKLFKDSTTTIKSGITFTVKLPYGLVEDDAADQATDTPKYNGAYAFIGDTIMVTTPGSSESETVPQTGQAQVEFNPTLNAIQVKFVGENLDAATVTKTANYTFDGAALPSGTIIEYNLDDTKAATDPDRNTAYIYLPANSVERDGNYKLTIKGVATKGGAEMLPTNVWVYEVPDNTQPVMTASKVTSDNTVEVTFDETLDMTNSDLSKAPRNFKVIINGVKFNIDTVAQKGTSTRTLVLTTVDTFDYSSGVNVELALDASNDMFIEDEAGNLAAGKVIKATIDIQ